MLGHILTGPIRVATAQVNQVLEVEILDIKLRQDWGYNFIRPLSGGLPGEFHETTKMTIKLDQNLQEGDTVIVSDSLVNVNLFNPLQPQHSIASTNGDLFELLYQTMSRRNLRIQLFWVQGHLDKKVPKLGRTFPVLAHAANHVADHYAGEAARLASLAMHEISPLVFRTKLVKIIQRRVVRIIISCLPSTKHKYEKKSPTLSRQPTIDDCLASTQHNLVVDISQGCKNFRCLDCGSSVSSNSSSIRAWLLNRCEPLPFDDRFAAVPVPKHYTIHKGSAAIHSSHDVRSIRGISFCFKCGAFGKVKLHRLATQCVGHCVSKVDESRRDKLMQGELPVSGMLWPSGASFRMQPPAPAMPSSHFLRDCTE